MSRYRSSGSDNHQVRRLGRDRYRLFWTVDRYYPGDRLRHPIQYSRDSDRAGASRFVRRWKITRNVPEQLTAG
jgi:hypothetical protein